MNPILTDYNKILEGCKIITNPNYTYKGEKITCGYKFPDDSISLCPSCKRAKQVFLQRCQSELERVNNFWNNTTARDSELMTRIILDWMKQLKEVLEMDK